MGVGALVSGFWGSREDKGEVLLFPSSSRMRSPGWMVEEGVLRCHVEGGTMGGSLEEELDAEADLTGAAFGWLMRDVIVLELEEPLTNL